MVGSISFSIYSINVLFVAFDLALAKANDIERQISLPNNCIYSSKIMSNCFWFTSLFINSCFNFSKSLLSKSLKLVVLTSLFPAIIADGAEATPT